VNAHSLDFDQTASFALDSLENTGSAWAEYVKGTAWALRDAGYALRGWDGVLAGDVPIGAGLSSSARRCPGTRRRWRSWRSGRRINGSA
jgi:galactokinase